MATAEPTKVQPKIVADINARNTPGLDDGGLWDYASVDSVTRRVYVARGVSVMAIDLSSMRVTNAFMPAQHAHAVLPLPGGQEILITNGDSNTAVIADGITGKVRATIHTGAKPDAALFDKFTGDVLVMAADDGRIDMINPQSGTLVGSINIGGGLEAAVSDGAGHVAVNIEDQNALALVDMASHKVTARIALNDCEGPTGIALDPRKSWVVSVCANGVAKVTDIAHGKAVATLQIGKGPDAAIFNAANEHVLVPSGKDATLSEIALDGASPSVVRVMGTRPGARTAAFDPKTGYAFLPYGNAPKGEDKKRHLTPGSFGVLIIQTR
ncbi:hypothetical protein AA0498_0120 [Acidomonas methanolica]|uniref:YncE family protein n=1 Tax=Acidomonas methanolica NBRC 104435 TaxID=1231351 RepID=A0A023D6B5_ACIMT|nr:hypothetical protein Amme_059_004 [Acidomonas methanolica NBRC 104435]GBQ45696.1 hypothetical protein AA0498_0120 [Acidomonas methanolica]GEK99049.1 hypothetical protein AME01nite_15480 [Acidomonas methanolica NBRC 104435]